MGSILKTNALILLLALTACTTAGGQDLFSNSVSNRATADAAIQVAQYQEQFLTASAQAPIIDITSTAAAFAMEQSYAQATSTAAAQTQVAAMTVTAQSWTSTPNATTTAVFAQSYADATRVANEIVLNNLDVERTRNMNQIRAMAPYFIGFLVVILVVMFGIAYAKRLSFMPATVDERGKVIPIISVVNGSVVDVDRNPNYRAEFMESLLEQWLRRRFDLPRLLPEITAERQDIVTARVQLVDMATRARLPRKLLEAQGLIDADDQKLLPMDEEGLLIDFPLPEWDAWMKNWKPGHLALGVNEKGLLQADPERNPHFLFAGTTGSWKTRGGVRVLVTCALASGWQVIIAGKQLDFKVFEHHPNAYLVPFSMLENPTRAVDLLRSVYGEIERRNNMMSRNGHSLWAQTGKSRTMVVVDEFSNLADALEDVDVSKRKELWRWARMDTAEARKYGIHMVYALQDPTAQSIDLRIRRNTTPVMFRVKDATSSRTLLNSNGAEVLSARQFLTVMVGLERGAAFAPSDEEIGQFLTQHAVSKVSDDEGWIEGVISDAPAKLPDEATEPAASLSEFVSSLDERGIKVVEMYQAGGMSDSEIGELAYGYSNGTIVRRVKSIIERYRDLKITTTTTPQPVN